MTQLANQVQWGLGDWAIAGADAGYDLDAAADEIGLERSTVRNYMSVARSFPPDRRIPGLSHAHHDAVVGLPIETADRLLAAACAEVWPVQRIREAARAERGPTSHQLPLPLELAPTGDAWRRDAQRIERATRSHLRTAGVELTKALDAVAILADHPGREQAHGNTVNAVIRRLGDLMPALPADVQARLRSTLDEIAAAGQGSPAGTPSADAGQPPAAAPKQDLAREVERALDKRGTRRAG